MIYSSQNTNHQFKFDVEIKVNLYEGSEDINPSVLESRRVIHLVKWPQMTLLPHNYLATTARVCALLARKPSASFLIHRRLNLPAHVVETVLLQLENYGYISISSKSNHSEMTEANITPYMKSDKSPNLWTKLLNKFRG